MSKEEIKTLVEDRHRLGLYSVIELAKMFSVGRMKDLPLQMSNFIYTNFK